MSKVTPQDIARQLNSKYKTKIIGTGLDVRERIPFTSPKLNYMTRGGIAVGKVTELYGAEGGGKTTVALDLIKNFQQLYPDKLVAYLDAENTLDEDWGQFLGVDFERVMLIKPEQESAETLLDIMLDAIKTGHIGMGVVDSIPFLIPKAVIEGTLEDKHYAGNSAVMTEFARKLVPIANKYKCTMILINQVRDKMGVTYTAYNTPGGRMLKHAYSSRLMFSKGALIDENYTEHSSSYETPAGHIINVQYTKNKISKNDRKSTSFTLHYSKGIDVVADTVELAIFLGAIRKSGAWYYLDEDRKFQGKGGLFNYLSENAEALADVYKEVNELAKE